MKRREFITLLGGTVAAWPLAARAQPDRVRRLGALIAYAESDPVAQSLLTTFAQGLQELGWTDGRNLQIDYRWGAGALERMRTLAKELVTLQPDVILSNTTPVTVALHRETSTIPIVFTIVSDPVGAGLVAGLPRPGSNVTGFINIEESMGGKWLELLKEIAPGVRRAAFMFNPDTAPGGGSFFFRSFEAAAQSMAVEPIKAAVRSDADIERIIAGLGREPGGGLVVSPDGFMLVHRGPIISLAASNKVPAIYNTQAMVKDGGLLSYGADNLDIFRRAASYVDRILRGAKPADMPVQVPTKFELLINLKAAKALGLDIPATVLARADDVIE
jgi:putative ABC transport system substrate-binding protein